MKSITTIVGILLILLGIVSLAYEGFTYTTQKKVAEIGNIQVTQEQEKSVRLPPILGGVSIVIGLALVVLARTRVK